MGQVLAGPGCQSSERVESCVWGCDSVAGRSYENDNTRHVIALPCQSSGNMPGCGAPDRGIEFRRRQFSQFVAYRGVVQCNNADAV